MALPIAQLGYMPNLSTPSGGGVHQKRNPWQDLAMTILAGVAESGLKNTFAGDNTSTAQTEGLLQDPKAKDAGFLEKFLKGPTTSDAQLAQLRQQRSTRDIANTAQYGETSRTKKQLASTDANSQALRNLQEVMQSRQLTSEEARTLAGNTNAASIASGRNFTDLSGIDKQVAGALEREKLGNATSTTNATIMANGMSGQAQMGKLYNQLQGNADLQRYLHPNDPAAPVTADEILNFISKFKSGQAPK